MKRVISVVLCVFCVLCFASCKDSSDSAETKKKDSSSFFEKNTGETIEEISNEPVDSYKLYYVIDSGAAGIMGFDDGISNSDISSMNAELESSGYSVEYIEIEGKNDIIIPDTVKNIPLYAIDGGAFKNCFSINSITIPNSVSIIEPGAFDGCNSDLIIYGEAGSEAEAFANENNIVFKEK